MFSAMSFGSISLNAKNPLQRRPAVRNTFQYGRRWTQRGINAYKDCAIVQVASGRFGVSKEYLDMGRIIEIKIGQGAKLNSGTCR